MEELPLRDTAKDRRQQHRRSTAKKAMAALVATAALMALVASSGNNGTASVARQLQQFGGGGIFGNGGILAALRDLFESIFGLFGSRPAPAPSPDIDSLFGPSRIRPPPTPAPVVPTPPTISPAPTVSPAPTFSPAPTTTFSPTPRPTPCQTPDLFVCENGADRVGEHCGLQYQIFGSGVPELGIAEDAKTSCITNTRTGFKASWKNADGNYLARKGVRPGSRRFVLDYTARVFIPGVAPAGLSLIGAYGFTTDPLVEYYVVENWGIVRPPPPIVSQTFLGNFTTAEGVGYDQYRTVRTGKPSIEGDSSTFEQFWSVRQDRSFGGTITLAEHFEAWEERGYDVGKFFEVSFVVEALNSEGFAEIDLEVTRK